MTELGLLFISALWALASMAVKVLSGEMNVYLISTSKAFYGIISLGLFYLFQRRKLRLVLDRWVFIGGFGYVVSQIFLNLGLSKGYAHASIVTYAFETIFITIYCHSLLNDKIRKVDVLGIMACVVGIFLINFSNATVYETLGSITLYLYILAGIGFCFSTLSHRMLINKYDTLDYIFSIHVVSFLLLLPLLVISKGVSDLTLMGDLKNMSLCIFLGINSGVTQYVFSRLLARTKFLVAVIVTKSILVFNIIFSRLFFQEEITIKAIGGMLVIMVSMIILSIRNKPKEKRNIG